MLTEFQCYLGLTVLDIERNQRQSASYYAEPGLASSITDTLLWPLRHLYATVTGDSCRRRIIVQISYNMQKGEIEGSTEISKVDARLEWKEEDVVPYAESWSTAWRVMAYALEFLFLPLLLVGTLIGLAIYRCGSTPQQLIRSAHAAPSQEREEAVQACTDYFFPDAELNKLALNMVAGKDVRVAHRI
jgi:hypothetical protein